MLSVLAVLTACAADELVSQGQNQTPGDVETVASGTINFANQTAMTIGTSSAFGQTKAMTHPEDDAFYGNDACELTMPDPEEVTVPDGASKFDDFSGYIGGNITSGDVIITSTSDCTLSGSRTIAENSTVYVEGKLTVENPAVGGTIVVLEGGELRLSSNSASLSNTRITNYGTVVLNANSGNADHFTIGDGAVLLNYGNLRAGLATNDNLLALALVVNGTFKTSGDLTLWSSLSVAGEFYVGGDLQCTELIPMTNPDACVHVIGNLTAYDVLKYTNSSLSFTNPFDLCVEGTLECADLTVSCMANMHIGCKLEVDDKLTLNSGAVILANYIKTSEAEMGGNSSAQVNVWLPSLGVAELGAITLYENVVFKLYGSEKGLVTCTSLDATATGGDLTRVFGDSGDSFYVNYVSSTPETLVFADENLVKVAELLTSSKDNCKPDFTVPEPEPDPEPEPGEIILPIGDLALEQDFTLLADDFAIRVNGDYLDIVVDGNTATLDNIKILHGDDMVIKVTGLDETNILEGNDYTYECYIWIDNTAPLNDGTGGYGPLFDDELKQEWANPSWDPYDDPTMDNYDYYGVDMTSLIKGVKSPAGYAVRYNVYRGISGRLETDGDGIPVEGALGDTPYIKVSIHVQRDDDAAANSAVGIYPKIE